MNEFVEKCREEWRRIGVSDRDAEEMAEDLAADLAAAAADGISAEEFLGSSASDPRGFAASWAAGRGLIHNAPQRTAGRSRGRPALVAFTVVASIVLVGTAILLATGQPRLALSTSGMVPPGLSGGGGFVPPPDRVLAGVAAPIEWILLVFSALALAFCAWLWSRRGSGSGVGVRPL